MDRLEARLCQLERSNRRLRVLCMGSILFPLLAIAGFQTQGPQELVKAKLIQIVDSRGVPLVTLGQTRGGGGSLVLRDESGDRRMWLTTEGGTSHMGIISGEEDQPKTSVGLTADSKQARLVLSGSKASSTMYVEDGKPSVDLVGSNGQTMFSAPWRKGQ